MKKYTLLIIIGGIFLIAGIILYNGKKDQPIYYTVYSMSQDEAKALIIDKTKLIMDLYENISESFIVENNTKNEETPEEENKEKDILDEYVKVSNYDDVVNSLFTENGKTELESIKFKDKAFVLKKDDGTYILSKIPSDNSYLNSSIFVDDVKITDDQVKALVSFSSDKVDSERIDYYIYEKDIILVKKDDKWFVDTFMYPNV